MSIITERTLGETIVEKCKIIEVQILEMDIEIVTEMTTLEEVRIGLEKYNTQVILEGMIDAVAVGQDQVQDPVLTEIKFNVLSVGNMIICQTMSEITNRKRTRTNTTNV